jgi:hypothetical protein
METGRSSVKPLLISDPGPAACSASRQEAEGDDLLGMRRTERHDRLDAQVLDQHPAAPKVLAPVELDEGLQEGLVARR